MTDEQLVYLLQHTNLAKRHLAVDVLAMRYRKPGTVIYHVKHPPQVPYAAEKQIPSNVVQGIFNVAMYDDDERLRVAAAHGMQMFLGRTNIFPFYERMLNSTNATLKIHVVKILLSLRKMNVSEVGDYNDRIFTALSDCLDLNQKESVLRTALSCVMDFPLRRSELILKMEALTHHTIPNVRGDAKKTLRACAKTDR